MALDESSSIPFNMPVAPAYGGGGFGGFGGADGWWIILLLLFAGGGFGNGFGGGYGGGYDFPWLMTGQQNINTNTNNGFRDAMINDGINGIQNGVTSGFGDVQTALCGGFASVNAAIANANTASLERSFAAQTAVAQDFNSLQSQLAQCCCDNRLATCQTQNLVASESAATRLAIENQTRAIIDKLCQQEIDALKAQNLALSNQVNMLNLAASQTAQTAQLIADNTAQTQYIVNRVAPYPIPAYTVANPVTPATT